jgi:hypothetical protein
MRLRIAFLLLIVGSACAALAVPDFFDRFNLLYHPAPGSDLAKAKCSACHAIIGGPPVRNPYGQLVESLVNHDDDGTPNGGVNRDVLIFAEKQDSDGDGYSNLEEIVSGTLPGDPNSHPKTHPTNLPKHEMSRKLKPLYLQITGGLFAIGILAAIAGKAAKQASLGKVGIGFGILGLLAGATTFFLWFGSNARP